MAVQEPPKELVCPQCFECNPAGSPFCQNCGASLSNAPEAEGSDQAVYKDLASANLLRMRGQHKQAGEMCLSILKRYPNNATAHALLGDIYGEAGDTEQAIQWYELALDLHEDETVRSKLQAIQEKKQEAEHQASVTELGLPEKHPKTGLYIAILVVAIMVVGGGAFALGRQNAGDKEKPTLNGGNTVSLPNKEEGGPEPAPMGGTPHEGTMLATKDSELTAQLQKVSMLQGNILYVVDNPRGPSAIITTHHAQTLSLQQTAAQAGIDALGAFTHCTYVTVRVISSNQVAYVADIYRADLLPGVGVGSNSVTEDQAASLVRNVWPPPADQPSGQTPAQPNTSPDASVSSSNLGEETSSTEGPGGQ